MGVLQLCVVCVCVCVRVSVVVDSVSLCCLSEDRQTDTETHRDNNTDTLCTHTHTQHSSVLSTLLLYIIEIEREICARSGLYMRVWWWCTPHTHGTHKPFLVDLMMRER